MKTTKMLTILVLALGLMVLSAAVSKAAPMGTAWTYQGRLIDDSQAADGFYDFEFKLFDDPCKGTQQGGTIEVDDLDVIDGYFTVELDFRSSVFEGEARWLEISVRPGDSKDPRDFVTLIIRQEVTPTPYAIYAQNAQDAHTIDGLEASDFAGKLHVHPGEDITTGTVHTNRYSAFDDLGAEGYLGNAYYDLAQNNGTLQTNLNADMLDGHDSAAFAAVAHSHAGEDIVNGTVGEQYIAASIARDSEIMSTVLANDGTGSGLDADRLDGYSAGSFASVSHDHDSLYYKESESDSRFVNVTGDLIVGSSSLSLLTVTNNGSGFGVWGYAAGISGRGVLAQSAGTMGIGLYGEASAASGKNYGGKFKTNSPDGYGVYSEGRLYVEGEQEGTVAEFADSISTRMIIKEGGNVGIGTTQPATKLDIGDMARVRGSTWPSSGKGMELAYSNSEHKGYVQVYDRDATEWGDLYLGSRNVGVGTVSPESKLHVAGGSWNLATSEGDFKVGDSDYRLKIGVATGGGGAGDVRIRAQGGTNRLILGSDAEDIIEVQNSGVKIGSNGTSFAEIRELTGMTTSEDPGGTWLNTHVPLPTGWNDDNTRVLSLEIKINNGSHWEGLGSGHYSSYSVSYSLFTDSLTIVTANESWYRGEPYRMLIMKMN